MRIKMQPYYYLIARTKRLRPRVKKPARQSDVGCDYRETTRHGRVRIPRMARPPTRRCIAAVQPAVCHAATVRTYNRYNTRCFSRSPVSRLPPVRQTLRQIYYFNLHNYINIFCFFHIKLKRKKQQQFNFFHSKNNRKQPKS